MALDLCKYYKKQRFVSYNNGLTWQPLDEYEKGELYEAHSASCGAGVFQYRWVLINNGYICDGKDRYTREIYQYSEDGTVWYNVFPTQYRKGTLVETDSPFCDNAGNGQYTSGDTDPTSGDTPPCPTGYFWNGTECECNGEVIDGVCHPCPTNYKYNKTTHECECQGHFDDYGNCIVCAKNEYWNETTKQCECGGRRDEFGNCIDCPPHSSWNEQQQQCICERWWEMRNGVCVYVDPLKTFKCSDSDGVLRQSDVNYYESGWAVMSYTIGDCIYRIDDNAFNGQQIMTSVTIPNSVEEVGTLAFANCKHLPSIHFPSNITSFGAKVFYGCSSLRVVNFGGTIPSTIQPYMFDGCFSLESASWLNINNITSIGEGAFRYCSALSNVTLPQSLTYIGNAAFLNNYSLTNITIPSGVTEIGYNAFANCTGLTFVNIDSNNILLNNAVFANCTSLTAATFNSSAVTIGSDVFYGCTRLLKLTFTSPTPFEIEDGDFDNTNECAIFVPCGSLEAYKTAWSQYADRISCNDTGVYYRWVDAEGTYCVGYDEYTREKKQSTTNGITWTDTGDYRLKDLITHYSENCGYSDEVALTVTHSDGITRYYEPCNEQPTPDVNKLVAKYSDSTTYNLVCDGNSDLSQNEIQDFTTSYTSMTSATVGNCVAYINDNAFNGCTSLVTATLPSTIGEIGSRSFYGLDNMSGITINAAIPPLLGYYGAFDVSNYPPNNYPIYVPCDSYNDYIESWSSYASRIKAFPTCDNPSMDYVLYEDGFICEGDKKYEAYKKVWSCDNVSWFDVEPKELIKGNEISNADGSCPARYIVTDNVWSTSTNYGSLSSETENYDFYENSLRAKDNKTRMTIEVRGYDEFTFKIRSGSYPNSNFIIVANLDDTSWSSYSNHSVYPCSGTYGGRCIYTNSQGVTDWKDVTFKLNYEPHTITIWNTTYIYDYSYNTSYVALPTNYHNELKFRANYSNGTSFSVHCDASGALTSGVTKPSGYEYSAMTEAEIGNCVTSIGKDVFSNCSGLTSCNIPSGVTTIGDNAFEYCRSLTSIVIPDSVTSIGYYAFDGCSGLTSCTIGSGVTSFSTGAFENCTSLTSINIPNGVTSIGYYLFYGCTSLTSVTIGSSVTEIGDDAFCDCSSLTRVTCLATTPPALSRYDVFKNTNNCPIYVPAESVDTYKAASNWSSYASRIQAIPN